MICDKKSISIKFTNKQKGKLKRVFADEDKIYRVMKNLLGNSHKFTDNGGKIVVSMDYFKKDKKFLQIQVKDNGIGIPKEGLDKIFEKFSKVDNHLQRDYEGTGLGLSIVRGIIKKLGGKIWVESKEGKGSTFTFTLPVIDLSC